MRAPPPGSDEAAGLADRLPRGRIPRVGIPELVAALHRRREGRRRAVAELRAALEHLATALEHRHARIAELLTALDATSHPRDGD